MFILQINYIVVNSMIFVTTKAAPLSLSKQFLFWFSREIFVISCYTCCDNPLKLNCCFFQLTPGGKAAQAGVGVGDWVVSICDANAEDMTHVEAQNQIRAATDSLTLTLSR